MHRSSARPRGRTRRALLAAALPAAVAAFALPAAAQAATVELASDGTLNYRTGDETNSLDAGMDGSAVVMQDLRGLTSRTPLCAQETSLRVRCGIGIQRMNAQLGSRDDTASIRVPFPVVVDGGFGNDTFVAGLGGPISSRVQYRGGEGFDQITYGGANRGVRIRNDGFADDGRIGLDQDDIRGDVERLRGSHLNDEITDVGPLTCCAKEIFGDTGDDVLRGASTPISSTIFDMGREADGADRIFGNTGFSVLDYSDRTRPVNATLGFNFADDGEAGERDEIVTLATQVLGGHAGDTLRAPTGAIARYVMYGSGGNDTLETGAGPDSLDGGAGQDTLSANGGNDFIAARDGESDVVGCGLGTDTAVLDDNRDGFNGCENRPVGVLRLAPKTMRAKAGETARLKLSWRHPKAWKQLRTIELRLTRDGKPVGAITIRPKRERISADGAVRLVRRGTRMTAKGKAVAASLAVRLDEALAGQKLRVEVEAIDTRGRRQLERRAGTIRVAR